MVTGCFQSERRRSVSHLKFSTAATVLIGVLAAGPGVASAQSGDVVGEAEDAFGVRIGVERFGLYSERQVRGFSLEAAGNYRIDGLYYTPVTTPANPTVADVTIRVGLNALQFDFPSPSGVVDYALRGPSAEPSFTVRGGIDGFETPFVEGDFSVGTEDLGLAGGVQLYDSNFSDASEGDFWSVGFVPQWRPVPGLTVKGLISYARLRYDGDQGFVSGGAFIPPYLGDFKRLAPENGSLDDRTGNYGATVRYQSGPTDWFASAFLSTRERPTLDFLFVSDLDRTGLGEAVFITSPENTAETYSGEAGVRRRFDWGDWEHLATLSVRGRQSEVITPLGRVVPVGPLRLTDPQVVLGPIDRSPTSIESVDQVDQLALGASLRTSFRDGLELRLGAQRMRYEKEEQTTALPASTNLTEEWLYNGSITARLSPRLTAYGSYTRGIEESGSAPLNAVNRGAVLPPVLAEQAEIGARWQVAENVSLVASAFVIEKPIPGLDANGMFGLTGDVRHTGLEVSLNARPTPDLTLVAGAVQMDLDREAATAGEPDGSPVGVASTRGLIGFTWRPEGERFSFDGQAIYDGPRFVDLANTVETEGYWALNLGARYRFGGDEGPVLRAQVVNALGVEQWIATPSGLLAISSPRTWRLTLSRSF
jgi:iron complex outermembrane recepter protein